MRTAGDLFIERTGNIVVCSINEVSVDRSSGNARLYTIPSGFLPQLTVIRSSVFWKASSQIKFLDAYSTGGFWMHHGGPGEVHSAQLCWTTVDGWPTVLPGTAFA